MLRTTAVLAVVVLASACAQVPKESVELSATVGRDIAELHKAHRATATLLFGRMRGDINRFIDNVYAPYQIDRAMKRQSELAMSTDPNEKRKSLLLAVNAAFTPPATPLSPGDESKRRALQGKVLKAFERFVVLVRNDVEQMRGEMLAKLDAQETEVMDAINRSYQQAHYANSIVTGHLSTVLKVHDAQQEMLAAVGLEDVREEIGTKLAKTSNELGKLVEKAESVEGGLDKAEDFAGKINDALGRK